MPAVHLRVNRPDRRMRPLLHRVDRQQQHQRQTVSKRRRPHLPGSQQKRVGLRGRSRNRPRRIIAGASVCGHHHQSKIEMLRPRMFMWFLVVRFFRSTLLEATPQICGQLHASQVTKVTSRVPLDSIQAGVDEAESKNCIAACKSRATIVVPALVAQLDRAPDYGSGGWGFESLQARRTNPPPLAGDFLVLSSARTTAGRYLLARSRRPQWPSLRCDSGGLRTSRHP